MVTPPNVARGPPMLSRCIGVCTRCERCRKDQRAGTQPTQQPATFEGVALIVHCAASSNSCPLSLTFPTAFFTDRLTIGRLQQRRGLRHHANRCELSGRESTANGTKQMPKPECGRVVMRDWRASVQWPPSTHGTPACRKASASTGSSSTASQRRSGLKCSNSWGSKRTPKRFTCRLAL
jgi:hypothetical protein